MAGMVVMYFGCPDFIVGLDMKFHRSGRSLPRKNVAYYKA
jgi:hypothetical protein